MSRMMPLFNQVYQGKIDEQRAKMNEFGGQKMEAEVVQDGIKIVATDQVSSCFIFLPIVQLVSNRLASV